MTKQQKQFQVGDKIFDNRYGYGEVKKLDLENRGFPYYVEYEDGTKIWYRAGHVVLASEVPPNSKPTPRQKQK